jgi:CubicO group peptidase (beta-lactamase class C family)
MGSAIPQEWLAETVREAQARTGISVVAAALHVDGRTVFAGEHDRSFRIASITKSVTATAVFLRARPRGLGCRLPVAAAARPRAPARACRADELVARLGVDPPRRR